MISGFFDLAVVVLIAAVLSVIAKLFKQPLLLAYMATGFLVAQFGLFDIDIANSETFHVFSNLGVMFLLFLVGLEINYTSLRLIGRTAILVGIGQIVFTALIGFLIALALGFQSLPAIYIAIALTFSSTIVIVKLLSDKKDLNSLYGKISIGFLLVQDVVAILLLVVLSGIEHGSGLAWQGIIGTILKGLILFALMIWLGRKALPHLFDKIARSQELLFLVSLMWVFLVAAVVSKIGFSIEIAGFLAGLALANSSENHQIAYKIRPLRDFFIVIFFVLLGSLLGLSNLAGLSTSILIFSLFVLIGNPLIVLIIMGLMGYRKRTSFMAGVTVAQISEFSLILAALGLKLGHISDSHLALITAVGVLTITLSTYMVVYNHQIFSALKDFLSIFERRKMKVLDLDKGAAKKSVVLIGCHRTGQNIARSIKKEDLLIVDFDPDIIEVLKKENYDCLLGDTNDEEILGKIDQSGAKLIISTSPDLEDNLMLIESFNNQVNKIKPKLVIRAETEREAKILYQKGVDYVLLPHFTSGQYLAKAIIKKSSLSETLRQLRENDLNLMRSNENLNMV